MQELQVERREIKYQMSLMQFKRLEARLGLALQRDGYARNGGGYCVRSLYFDTPYENDFYATIRGEEVRKKYRLRCYSPTDQRVKLERKGKFGQDQQKVSLNLTRQQAQAVTAGEYGFLTTMGESGIEAFTELSMGGYRPSLLIEYERVAFTAPANHIRVTFDSRIHFTKSTLDLFALDPPMTPLIHMDQGVLEIKYDRFLFSYIKELLSGVDALPVAFGKYALATERVY